MCGWLSIRQSVPRPMAAVTADRPMAVPAECLTVMSVAVVDRNLCSMLQPAMTTSNDWLLDVRLHVLRLFDVCNEEKNTTQQYINSID